MSYMTPYYFSGSAGMTMSIWLRSNDFQPMVGLAFSGSTASIVPASSSDAWGFDSAFSGAGIKVGLPSSSVYKVEATSTAEDQTGSFSLYISQADTASIITANTPGDITRILYSPISDRVFNVDLFGPGPNNAVVINPKNFTQTHVFALSGSTFDAIYNSVSNSFWVWTSGSNGNFFNEYSGDGTTLLATHSFVADWGVGGAQQVGQLAFSPSTNRILVLPYNAVFAVSYSIYDCSSNTVVNKALPVNIEKFVAYVSSSNNFYMSIGFTGGAASGFKVNATTFVTASVPNLTGSSGGSGFGLGYVDAVDKLFFEVLDKVYVFDPSVDRPVASIPGFNDFQFITYDPCKSCLVISDDGVGDPNFNVGGGLVYVSTGSYQPLNFVNAFGIYSITYAVSESSVFYSNYYDSTVRAVVSAVPTGSLPQPTLPTPGPTASFNCVAPTFNAVIFTGSLTTAEGSSSFGGKAHSVLLTVTQSLTSQSISAWARSSVVDTFLAAATGSTFISKDADGGWIPSGDLNNAALNFVTNAPGTYSIELSSNTTGACSVYVSPGPQVLTGWSGSTPVNLFYISSSNYIGIAENSRHVVFYNINGNSITRDFTFPSCFGGVWSAAQDKVFAWFSDGNHNVIGIFDHTGSLLSSSSIEPFAFWVGALAYDNVHDRILIIRNGSGNLQKQYGIWDMNSHIFVNSGSLDIASADLTYCTYATVNNRFYVSSHAGVNTNAPMTWIDATTFVSGTTTTQVHDFIEYVPQVKRIVGAAYTGVGAQQNLLIINPATDTITTSNPSLKAGTFESATYDPCTSTTVIAVDLFSESPNPGGLVVMDGNFNVVNFVAMYNQSSSFNPSQSTGQATYGLCWASSSTKMYVGTGDFGNHSSSLWSAKITVPSASFISF